MHVRKLSGGILGLMLAGAVACGGGGGGDQDAADHGMDATGEHDLTAAAETAAGDSAVLGGGTATEVHPGDEGSTHVKVDWVVDGANISIAYGRPYLKDRVIGESVEPIADRVWRLGADEATTLVTDTDLMLGSAHVPAGEYTLWAAHMNDAFHLIINTETGQWGTSYNPDNDLAHAAMEVGELAAPTDQLTLKIEGGKLGFDWGTMTASVPLMVH